MAVPKFKETREAVAKIKELEAKREAVQIYTGTVTEDVYRGDTDTSKLTETLKAAAVNGWRLSYMTTVYAEKIGVNRLIHTLVFDREEQQ